MLEGQARMPQEGGRQRWSPTDAGESGTKRTAQREDVDRAEVREFAVSTVTLFSPGAVIENSPPSG
jgi:hypothetical protein